MLRDNTQMLTLTLVPVLFILFYIVPGAVLISNSLAKEKRLENIAFATLLSLVFAPLTLTLLGRVAPGNDSLLMAGYISFWALAIIGLRFFPATVKAWLPDFSALPKADTVAWLVSALLVTIVVALRLGIFQGNASQIGGDDFHLPKLTSIAATGLPSLYARQPLYPFTYYDLGYIAPALWVRYADGAVGIALAWVVHIGVLTFAISLFLTRLIYMLAATNLARLFGLVAIHAATGLDLLFLPWLQRQQELMPGLPHLENWPFDLDFFDGFIQISMPITQYAWVPQHLLGVAAVGLIYFVVTTRPNTSFSQALAVALLLVGLFRTSIFAFVGAVPGLALWYLTELLTGRERLRQLMFLVATALAALALAFPYLADLLDKQSFLLLGLRSFAPLDMPVVPWLRFPITVLAYLLLEIGILIPLLLWLALRPRHHTRSLLFWLCMAVGLLIPFTVQSPIFNDIAMRGVMPAQLAAALLGCYVIATWEHRNRRLVTAVASIQIVLSLATVGTEMSFRFLSDVSAIPPTVRWITRNTPPDALVFYEQPTPQDTVESTLEINYGQRMSYVQNWKIDDRLYTPVPFSAWSCLPDVNLYNVDSLCSIEAHIPGVQPVYVRYLSRTPSLDQGYFRPEYVSENGSIYSLSCPIHDMPGTADPPIWMNAPHDSLRGLLAAIPFDHSISASSHVLMAWLQSEGFRQQLFPVVPEPNAALNVLSQSGFHRTVRPEQEGASLASKIHLQSQLDAVDASSSPVWILLDYTSDTVWNDKIYSHVQDKYFVAQPNVARAQWLPCDQRVVLALPSGVDDLHAVQSDISFGEQIIVNEWNTTDRARRAGEFVPMELAWRQLEEGQFKFFVHLLDQDWAMHAQIDLPAAHDGSGEIQLTRMGLYLPPDLSAGQYQIRLGVYRPEDGQRLTLPSGEDSAHILLTVSH